MLEKFESYLLKEKRSSAHTVNAYIKDVESFLEYIQIDDLNILNEISYHLVRSWMVNLIDEGLNNRSVNRKLSSLRTFFKWAKRNGHIEIDPMLRITGPKQNKRLPEFVKEEEIDISILDELFSADFSGKRDRIIFELLYQTGIRLSELINIKNSDFQNSAIKVLGKRNKERIIPISPLLEKEISEYMHLKSDSQFDITYLLCTNKGKKLYPKFVYRKINYYLSLVTSLGKKSPHVLRHTFATHMLNNGAGLESLKEVLGHASLSATQIYTHNSFEEINKIYKQAHPRGHKKE